MSRWLSEAPPPEPRNRLTHLQNLYSAQLEWGCGGIISQVSTDARDSPHLLALEATCLHVLPGFRGEWQYINPVISGDSSGVSKKWCVGFD